jgi:hypothetical protein
MGLHERTLQTAQSADQSAIIRAQRKLKKTSEFESMNELQQKDALANVREQVLERRYLP